MRHSLREEIALLLLAVSVAACSGSARQQTSPEGESPSGSESPAAPPNDGGDDASAPSPGAASFDAAACSPSSITFSLVLPASPEGELSCLGASQTLPAGWATSWLSITGPGGESLVLDAPCNVVCGGQLANLCYVADCQQEPLPPTSSSPTRTWDGTTYSEGRESASCASPGPFICYEPACAPAGDYVAQMCATPLSTTDASSASCGSTEADAGTPVCTQVPFHWPPAAPGTVVVGSLATPDAG